MREITVKETGRLDLIEYGLLVINFIGIIEKTYRIDIDSNNQHKFIGNIKKTCCIARFTVNINLKPMTILLYCFTFKIARSLVLILFGFKYEKNANLS